MPVRRLKKIRRMRTELDMFMLLIICCIKVKLQKLWQMREEVNTQEAMYVCMHI
jgi:hypothetical protein